MTLYTINRVLKCFHNHLYSGDIRIVSLLQSEPVDSTDYVSEIATKITDTMTEKYVYIYSAITVM